MKLKNMRRISKTKKIVVIAMIIGIIVTIFGLTIISTFAGTYKTNRVAFLTSDNVLYVKEGNFDTAWVKQKDNVVSYQIEQNRVAVQTKDASLYVKEGSLDSPFTRVEGGDVLSFSLFGNRIAMLTTNRILYVKEGALNTGWIKQSENVTTYKLDAKRIAALTVDEALLVKDGSVDTDFVRVQYGDIASFEIKDNRIALLTKAKILYVKEGALNSEWIKQADNVNTYQLDKDRIAALTTDGVLNVREGGLDSPWIALESGDVSSYKIKDNRVALLTRENTLFVKQGSLNLPWVEQMKNVKSFELSGEMLAVQTSDSVISIKDGALNTAWFKISSYGVSFQLVQTITTQEIIFTSEKITSYNITLSRMTDIQLSSGATKSSGYYWISANRADILKYLNVANVKDGVSKFQFVDLSASTNIDKADMDNFLYKKGMLSGQSNVYLDAAKKYSISEVYLAAHSALETGNGTSQLAKGIVVKGVKVYNMFGIGAIDSNPIGGGSQTAYDYGWTTPAKAISGGAKWISERYINNSQYKQNTLYKMRWNPSKPGVHQYATDIAWANSQAYTIKNMYSNFKNAKLKYDIPKYK